MARQRIVVGLDASAAARDALWWAVREAARTGARVLVVTAWPAADRALARDRDGLFEARLDLHRMQRDRIAEAVAGVSPRPPIARELVLADPVTALSHAAAIADVVVIGSDTATGLRGDSVAAALAHQLARRGHPAVLVVATAKVAEPGPVLTTAA
ncbi:universal stress protein [Phytohabitans sp. ZYX-F-186]|uniref:Universal stress protein n=1 Tax=Phytohabitans maris TaxID=3071409 RepID=A0ABU0ZYV6_9ACTN|nr:universal stress protein [Phytohabitans sp. ZYX-F-186]MDQ7911469.1 universal stress protein [Phytohabitans sp. ZYX-F-186]